MPLKNIGKAVGKMAFPNGKVAALGAGAFALGMGSSIGPAARDAALETTLGTPDADRYFTGRKFSARFLAGGLMPGPIGTMMQASAPGDSFAANPVVPTDPVVSGVGGSALGAAGGSLAGARFGGSAKAKIAGGVSGFIAGGALGAAAPLTSAMTYTRSNRDFFTHSPYGRSSSANTDLSAVGDIVLGMHNSRRGY